MRKQLRHAADYQAIRMRIDVCQRRRNLKNGPIYIQILYCVQTLQAVPRLAKQPSAVMAVVPFIQALSEMAVVQQEVIKLTLLTYME